VRALVDGVYSPGREFALEVFKDDNGVMLRILNHEKNTFGEIRLDDNNADRLSDALDTAISYEKVTP
jgi:hypothetical protein